MIFSLSSCCTFCQVMTVSRFELSNTSRLFVLIFWRDVSEVRHAAQRLLPGIFRPLPSCFLSLPRYTNAHANWGSSILFVVSTVGLVHELHFKPKKKNISVFVAVQVGSVVCMECTHTSARPLWALFGPVGQNDIMLLCFCRPAEPRSAKVNDVIHSPLFFFHFSGPCVVEHPTRLMFRD